MATRVLLTGVTGFIGSHLAERLLGEGLEVHGIAVEPPPHPHLAAVADRVRIHPADLADLAGLRAAIAAARPDAVVHLAGQAIPSLAAQDAGGTVAVNVVGTANLLAALEDHPGTQLVYASSADVYGVPAQVPVAEDAPLRPTNVYAASKAAAEAVVREFGDRGTHPVVILRPANTNGPRQHPGLAASGFARQVAEAEAGLAEPVIRHGRLDAQRDFVDVRDVAAAYRAALDLRPERTETYNVGSGAAVSVEHVLRTLVQLAHVPVRTALDPARVRPGDATVVAVDPTRFRGATGWAPAITLERSLADTLDYWRSATARPVVPAR